MPFVGFIAVSHLVLSGLNVTQSRSQTLPRQEALGVFSTSREAQHIILLASLACFSLERPCGSAQGSSGVSFSHRVEAGRSVPPLCRHSAGVAAHPSLI